MTTMTPLELLTVLRRRGLDFRTDGDRLFVAPSSALAPDDAASLRQHKAALIALIDAEGKEAALAERTEREGPFVGIVESCLVRTLTGWTAVAPNQLLQTLNAMEAVVTADGYATATADGNKSVEVTISPTAGTPSSASRARRPMRNGSLFGRG